jgi:hypothetical protein
MGQPSLGVPPLFTDEQKVEYLLAVGSAANCGNSAMSCPGVGDYPSNKSYYYDVEIAAANAEARAVANSLNEATIKKDAVQSTASPLDLIPVEGAVVAVIGIVRTGKSLASVPGLVIGRGADLAKPGAVQAGEKILKWPSKLPNVAAEWKMNAGFLRKEMKLGLPIRDASPGNTGGMFLNAERNLLESGGWSFNPATNYWMPP